jgi:hypothetical protein
MAGQTLGVIDMSTGGTQSLAGISAPTVLKAAPGVAWSIFVVTAPTAGNLTVNDCLTVAGASEANQITSFAAANLVAGQLLKIGPWPYKTGIVISSVGTGGVFSAAWN